MSANTIRKITPREVVTTLAGSASVYGGTDGQGSSASFNGTTGLSIGPDGNLYVGDQAVVRKVTPSGLVTTLAGSYTNQGSTDGTGAAASVGGAVATAVDAAANVFVADTNNSVIRKITPAGVVTTVAGVAGQTGFADGQSGAAQFFYPMGIAIDAAGMIYVADTNNDAIRMITPDGTVSTIAGTPADNSLLLGANPRLHTPQGIAVIGTKALTITSNSGVFLLGLP